MSDDLSSEYDELTARVASAFARMPLPPGPSADEGVELVERTSAAVRQTHGVRPRGVHLTIVQQFYLGGVGVTVVAGLIVALLVMNARQPLSAMERMSRQLRDVTSYRYHISSTTREIVDGGKQVTTWNDEGDQYWQTPEAFRFEDKIVKRVTPVPSGGVAEEALEDFVEIVPAGKPGILIDHKRKQYFHEGPVPQEFAVYPWKPLLMIREGKGEVTRELGTRQIAGKQARGYVTQFESGEPPRAHAWDVWVDPDTELPLEIGYTVDDGKEPRTTTVLRADHFEWNIDLDARLFDATPVEGYREVPAPKD